MPQTSAAPSPDQDVTGASASSLSTSTSSASSMPSAAPDAPVPDAPVAAQASPDAAPAGTGGLAPATFKRLVVLADGTWKAAEAGQSPTNVLRLVGAIEGRGREDGHVQLVKYLAGLGTSGGLDTFRGGLHGDGIDRNIKELYRFLASNYDAGDEIYMIGFSRGAFTVRSLAGMLRVSGLVTRDKLAMVERAYEIYRDESGPVDRGESFMKEHCTRVHGGKDYALVPITCMVVFDTVGALGVPLNVKLRGKRAKETYEFHDTQISRICQNGIHIVSADEDRKSYPVTPMRPAPKWAPASNLPATHPKTQVTQLYLPGSHTGVGGGSEGHSTAQYALWVVYQELRKRCPGLTLNYDKLKIRQLNSANIPDDKFPIAADDAAIIALLTHGPASVSFWTSLRRNVMRIVGGTATREIEEMSQVAVRAFKVHYDSLATWRPHSLGKIEVQLKRMAAIEIPEFGAVTADVFEY